MTMRLIRPPATLFLALVFLFVAGCATTGNTDEGREPIFLGEDYIPPEPQPAPSQDTPQMETTAAAKGEGEVPLPVAESEPKAGGARKLEEMIIEGRTLQRNEVISSLVSEARTLLRDVELQYAFTGKGKKEVLRGRPVAFALWSEAKKTWTVAHIEIPRPPVKWKPGGKPLPFLVLTPGIQAEHIKGTGAERLMFAFSKDGEPLKVYGRKFPVFDNELIAKKQWRAVAQTARPIVYLPFTEDTLDPQFISGGKEFLLTTARKAVEELRLANAPSVAFPGERLADVVPAEVITTLAVIEQTDDADYTRKKQEAVDEVLNHYGLKREEAFRYSVSTAAALGPMQFTNGKRGNGTYSTTVRRCPEAKLDPNFERGATDLLNSMKAAICLFDLDLSQMKSDIRDEYRNNMKVLGIFPVAAYNGGPRNVTKLYNVIKKIKIKLDELSRPGQMPLDKKVTCPCLWKSTASGAVPVAIPKYNNENRGYIEKYQSILGVFD